MTPARGKETTTVSVKKFGGCDTILAGKGWSLLEHASGSLSAIEEVLATHAI